jgi:hypothetical protein
VLQTSSVAGGKLLGDLCGSIRDTVLRCGVLDTAEEIRERTLIDTNQDTGTVRKRISLVLISGD